MTNARVDPPSREQLQAYADRVGFWWHSIDLGQGVVTPGEKKPGLIARELQALRLPDLRGRSALDIGAYDGYYSFACERLGAQRVVALDHYALAMDLPKAIAYRRDCKARKVAPAQAEDTPYWHPQTLPGKRGFDTAHEALRSKVEVVVGDFMSMDLAPLGTFDVTLFLGVLYHMKDPLHSLERLAKVTRTMAVIETHAVAMPGYEHLELTEFYSSGQLNGDSSNWWGPNLKALQGMCLAAGFSRVEVVGRKYPTGLAGLRRRASAMVSFLLRRPYYFRAIVHAWK